MCELEKGGPIQVIEQDEVHGDEDGHVLMMIKLNLEKKKEKNKKPRSIGRPMGTSVPAST